MAIDETKVTMAYPNKIDKSTTLSGGSWVTSLPLSNIKNRVLKRRARTTDTLPSSTTFTVTWNKVQSISAMALVAHNLTTESTWQVKLYSGNVLVHDSGISDVWEPYYSTFDLEFEYDNWWSGKPDEDAIKEFTPMTAWFGDLFVVDKAEVFIYDIFNPAGYVEIGRAFFGTAWQPRINASFGAQFGTDVNTEVEESLAGTDYFDRRQPKRSLSFTLSRLTEEEAFGRAQDMQRELGIDKELLVAFDRQGDYTYHKTFLGRLQQLSALEQPYIDYYSSGFQILEIL